MRYQNESSIIFHQISELGKVQTRAILTDWKRESEKK